MDVRERPATLAARHPWETVRARFFTGVLARVFSRPARVLDLGAGDAYVASRIVGALPAGTTVTCVDAAYTASLVAELRETTPAEIAFAREAPAETFDAVVMLDVLEHIEDDGAFLRDVVIPRVRPGGTVLASVPAHQALFTQHDVMLGHHRRYSRDQLRTVLGDAGLRVVDGGGLFASLLVPRAVGKLVERVRGPRPQTGIGAWNHGRRVTRAIERVLETDARFGARLGGMTGLSEWALCERR